jgi:hypothetical protein
MDEVIVFKNDVGALSITHVAEGVDPYLVKDEISPTNSVVVKKENLPKDLFFSDAWNLNGANVFVDLAKAKIITHSYRRLAREEEFKPYDEIIAKQIPGADAVAAEAARQSIRDKYTAIQADIDSAPGVNELKLIVDSMKQGA